METLKWLQYFDLIMIKLRKRISYVNLLNDDLRPKGICASCTPCRVRVLDHVFSVSKEQTRQTAIDSRDNLSNNKASSNAIVTALDEQWQTDVREQRLNISTIHI